LLAGLSQEALAERAGLSVRGISDLERGLRRAPHPGTYARLADALELDDTAREALLAATRASLAPSPRPSPSPSSSPSRPPSPRPRPAATRLIERQDFLDRLDGFLAEVEAGQGRMVLLGGEAGVGKSVLVQHFCESIRRRATVHIGACDPLSTPTALGPLIDVAESFGQPLTWLLASGARRPLVFEALRTALGAHHPTVLVFEDIHWADEATLDLVRFLARRISSTPALFIATYRDDELNAVHPLRIALGDLATFPAVRRLHVPTLSEAAVKQLAHTTDINPEELYRQTGGNPFFVTEVLASGTHEVPPSVRDAVLARAARLPEHGRAVLEAAAVIGGRIDARLLDTVSRVPEGGTDACLSAGVLRADGDVYMFRHELGRTAILDTIAPTRRVELHRQILLALRASPTGPDGWARLAHHAESAHDIEAVLAFAPIAADHAARLQSHREAASQYSRALRFAHALTPTRKARLLEALAYECYLTDQSAAALEARRAALDIWQMTGDRLKMAENLRWLSRLLWFANRNTEARAAAHSAIQALEGVPEGVQHAWAYSNLAMLSLFASDPEGARAWGEQAIALAEHLGEREVLVHALNSVGSARADNDDRGGLAQLERSLELALDNDLEEHAARAYTSLSSVAGRHFELDYADRYLDAGLAYCSEHDLDSWLVYMQGWQARMRMLRGHWAHAVELAQTVLARPQLSPVSRINVLTVLGVIQARRGEPDAWRMLDEALAMALPTGEIQRLGPVYAARAEAAWLDGNHARACEAARAGYALAESSGATWHVSELACWRRRLGDLDEPPPHAVGPFALELVGHWPEARADWLARGCPYEAALACLDGDNAALHEALRALHDLGATRAVDVLSLHAPPAAPITDALGSKPTVGP
jgi:transcriptional regulator with XRE-family HTH domain